MSLICYAETLGGILTGYDFILLDQLVYTTKGSASTNLHKVIDDWLEDVYDSLYSGIAVSAYQNDSSQLVVTWTDAYPFACKDLFVYHIGHHNMGFFKVSHTRIWTLKSRHHFEIYQTVTPTRFPINKNIINTNIMRENEGSLTIRRLKW